MTTTDWKFAVLNVRRVATQVLEARTGFDSVPTIETLYVTHEGRFVCPWMTCNYVALNPHAMWRHVHGLTGGQHPRSFEPYEVSVATFTAKVWITVLRLRWR